MIATFAGTSFRADKDVARIRLPRCARNCVSMNAHNRLIARAPPPAGVRGLPIIFSDKDQKPGLSVGKKWQELNRGGESPARKHQGIKGENFFSDHLWKPFSVFPSEILPAVNRSRLNPHQFPRISSVVSVTASNLSDHPEQKPLHGLPLPTERLLTRKEG